MDAARASRRLELLALENNIVASLLSGSGEDEDADEDVGTGAGGGVGAGAGEGEAQDAGGGGKELAIENTPSLSSSVEDEDADEDVDTGADENVGAGADEDEAQDGALSPCRKKLEIVEGILFAPRALQTKYCALSPPSSAPAVSCRYGTSRDTVPGYGYVNPVYSRTGKRLHVGSYVLT